MAKVPSVNTSDLDDKGVPCPPEEVEYTVLTISEDDPDLIFPSTAPEIIITENYTKLLKVVLADDEIWKKPRSLATDFSRHASIITGQPGIGR